MAGFLFDQDFAYKKKKSKSISNTKFQHRIVLKTILDYLCKKVFNSLIIIKSTIFHGNNAQLV